MKRSWQESFEDYKRVCKKGDSRNTRYSGLRMKYDTISKIARNIEKTIMAPLSTDHIKFRGNSVEIVMRGSDPWRGATIHPDNIRKIIGLGYSKAVIAIDRLVSGAIQSFVANTRFFGLNELLYPDYVYKPGSITLDINLMSTLVDEAKEIIAKVDGEFMINAEESLKSVDKIDKGIEAFERALRNRDRLPALLKNETIQNWWDEFGLKEGTKIAVYDGYGRYKSCGIIKSVYNGKKDVTIHFTNGNKTLLSRVDMEWSFMLNNPKKKDMDVNRIIHPRSVGSIFELDDEINSI